MDNSDDDQAKFDLFDDDQWFDTTLDLTKKFNRMRAQVDTLTLTQEPTPLKGQILSRMHKQSTQPQPVELDVQKYAARINGLFNYKVSSKKEDDAKYLNKDKADRATVEQVMDPRTKMILFKMLNRDLVFEINGCISTGKEANVYHATTSLGENRAIKIYKTSILVFKDRDRYVSGEYRFRHGYCSSNPRKMVQTWAEKEMRNLKRLVTAGIPCPEPIQLRSHVLLMTFIGDQSGWYEILIQGLPVV